MTGGAQEENMTLVESVEACGGPANVLFSCLVHGLRSELLGCWLAPEVQ